MVLAGPGALFDLKQCNMISLPFVTFIHGDVLLQKPLVDYKTQINVEMLFYYQFFISFKNLSIVQIPLQVLYVFFFFC